MHTEVCRIKLLKNSRPQMAVVTIVTVVRNVGENKGIKKLGFKVEQAPLLIVPAEESRGLNHWIASGKPLSLDD